jgi:hypothetical protein
LQRTPVNRRAFGELFLCEARLTPKPRHIFPEQNDQKLFAFHPKSNAEKTTLESFGCEAFFSLTAGMDSNSVPAL